MDFLRSPGERALSPCVDRNQGIVDLSDVDLDEANLHATLEVLKTISGVRGITLGGHRVVSKITGRMLLKLANDVPSITSVDLSNTFFEEAGVHDRLASLVEANKLSFVTTQATRSTFAKCRSAQKLDYLKLKERVRITKHYNERMTLIHSICHKRLLTEQAGLRGLLTILECGEYKELSIQLQAHSKRIAAIVEWKKALRKPRERFCDVEQEARKAIIKDMFVAFRELSHLKLVSRHKVEEEEKKQRRHYRRQRYEVSKKYLQERQRIMKQDIQMWAELMKNEQEDSMMIQQRELEGVRKREEERREKLAREQRHNDKVAEEARKVKKIQREQFNERENMQRQERIVKSEIMMKEDKCRYEVGVLWCAEYKQALIAERKGTCRREKDDAVSIPPKVTLHNMQDRLKFFNTGQPIQRRVAPEAELTLCQPLLTYHGAGHDSDDDETPDEWVERKSRIHGGTVSFKLDTNSNGYHPGDSLDIVDKLVEPQVTIEVDTVIYHGVKLAKISSIERQDADSEKDTCARSTAVLGNNIVSVVMTLLPFVTEVHVSVLLQLIGFKTGLERPDLGSVFISIELELLFSTHRMYDGTAKGNISTSTRHIVEVLIAPSSFSFALPSTCISYNEGDGDCYFFRNIKVSQNEKLERCLDNWEGYTLSLRSMGVMCPRDTICYFRKPATKTGRAPYAAVDDDSLILHERKKTVTCGGKTIAHITTGILHYSDSSFVPSNQSPLLVFQLTGHMYGSRLASLLNALLFRNDSCDPLDGVRTIIMTLQHPSGEMDIIRLAIEVISEDTKTTVILGSETALFRRVTGDLNECLTPDIIVQEPVRVAPDAIVTDVDTENFNSGSLHVNLTKGVPQDQLYISSGAVMLESNNVKYKDVVVAHFSSTKHRNGTMLSLEFVRNASINAVQAIVRSLVFMTETSVSSVGEGIKKRKVAVEDILPGTVRAGTRELEFQLTVDQAEPVHARISLRVANALLVIPPYFQTLTYVEASDPIRLCGRFEVPPDLATFDGGLLIAEITNGSEPKDMLGLRLPDNGELMLGPKKDNDVRDLQMVLGPLRVVVGSVYRTDTKIEIYFRQEQKESKKMRKKDVIAILKVLTYQHKGDNPRLLRKVVSLSLDDGCGAPSTAMVQVTVQPVNDVTQIMRESTKAEKYRQESREDIMGYCPFQSCSLYDADTEIFSGGYLTIEILQGVERGTDNLTLLPSALQLRKDHSCKQLIEIEDSQVLHNSEHIGDLLIGQDFLKITFPKQSEYPTIQMVERLMRVVRYRSTAKRLKPSTVVMLIRVAGDDGPEGRLKVPINVMGPLITIPSGVVERVWRDKPITVIPTVVLNLPDRHKCLGVYITCSITDWNSDDLLGFCFDDSPFHFTIKRWKNILDGSKELATITERTDHSMRVNFVSNGACTAKHVSGLLKCLSFTHRKPPSARSTRSVDVIVHVQDALPGMIVQSIAVCEPGRPTELILRYPIVDAILRASPMKFLVDCNVEDNYTLHFEKGMYISAEVLGSKNLGEDILDFALPNEYKPGNGWFPSKLDLWIDGDGWVKAKDTRLGHVEGRGTAGVKLCFVNSTVEKLGDILRCMTYVNTAKRAAQGAVREVLLSIKSGYPKVMRRKMTINLKPPMIDPGGAVVRIQTGERSAPIIEAAEITASNYASAELTVGFVRTAASEVYQKCSGWEITLEHPDISISKGGVVSFDDTTPYIVLNQSAQLTTIEFTTTDTALIQKVIRCLTLRNTDTTYRFKYPVIYTRLVLETKTFAEHVLGPKSGYCVVGIDAK